LAYLTRLAVVEPFETWPGMELAAEQRFWDGLALASGVVDHRLGGVYLLGYSAEMLLKTAYFRFVGVPPGDDIAPYLRAVRAHALWRGRNLHDLRSWLDFLLDFRRAQGHPVALSIAGLARIQVLAVDVHWRESLRYASLRPLDQELNQVYESVEWLRNNHALLWR
jgi:hypothetical protein